jgi:hypothetical protein
MLEDNSEAAHLQWKKTNQQKNSWRRRKSRESVSSELLRAWRSAEDETGCPLVRSWGERKPPSLGLTESSDRNVATGDPQSTKTSDEPRAGETRDGGKIKSESGGKKFGGAEFGD